MNHREILRAQRRYARAVKLQADVAKLMAFTMTNDPKHVKGWGARRIRRMYIKIYEEREASDAKSKS